MPITITVFLKFRFNTDVVPYLVMFLEVLEATDPITTDMLEQGDPNIEAKEKHKRKEILTKIWFTIKCFIVKHSHFGNFFCCSYIPAYFILLVIVCPMTYTAM